MASLHCSVLALNNWIDWSYSLDSQSYCGCHLVFIFLSSSLIKSPAVGLGKINQHFSIYSCFHEVLSITSNLYFIVLLFSFTLSGYRTQCWGTEKFSLYLNGSNYQVWESRVLYWICICISEWSSQGFMKTYKGCLSPLVLIKLIERRRPKALTFLTLLILISSQQGIVNTARIQQNNK